MGKSTELVPSDEPKEYPIKKICVKVYFALHDYLDVIASAERAGFRRGGLIPFIQKPHGFNGEKVANTDGISRFLKECWRNQQTTQDLDRLLNEMAKQVKK